MNRRDALRYATIPVLVAMAGCTEYLHRARGVDTPVHMDIRNETGGAQSVTVQIERDGKRVHDGTVAFGNDGEVISVDGDDFRDDTISEAGTYTLTVETSERQDASEFEVSWQQLADCNANSLEVHLREDDIRTGLLTEDQGCRFPDTLGSG